MKKTYTKPAVFFESFTPCTAIAAGCEVKTHTPAARKCGIEMPPDVIFLSSMGNVCTLPWDLVDSSGMFDNICYHVPEADNNLFNS